jgi:hypothetical protein
MAILPRPPLPLWQQSRSFRKRNKFRAAVDDADLIAGAADYAFNYVVFRGLKRKVTRWRG